MLIYRKRFCVPNTHIEDSVWGKSKDCFDLLVENKQKHRSKANKRGKGCESQGRRDMLFIRPFTLEIRFVSRNRSYSRNNLFFHSKNAPLLFLCNTRILSKKYQDIEIQFIKH